MSLSKALKRTAIIAGSIAILVVAVLVIVLAIGITINVDGIRARAEEAAAKAMGRKVHRRATAKRCRRPRGIQKEEGRSEGYFCRRPRQTTSSMTAASSPTASLSFFL